MVLEVPFAEVPAKAPPKGERLTVTPMRGTETSTPVVSVRLEWVPQVKELEYHWQLSPSTMSPSSQFPLSTRDPPKAARMVPLVALTR